MCSRTMDSRWRRMAADGGIAATLYSEGHAQIECRRRVRERTDGDVVDPGRRAPGDVVEGDAARCLEPRAAAGFARDGDGTREPRRAHVVEEQPVGTRLEALAHLLQVAALDLDWHLRAGLTRPRD